MVSFRSVILSPYGLLALSALCTYNDGLITAASAEALEGSEMIVSNTLESISAVNFLDARESVDIPKFFRLSRDKLKKMLKKLGYSTGLYENDKCGDFKKTGKKPQATNKLASVKAFGYPEYNERINKTMLHPRVSLSIFGNFPQPVSVRWEDFIIQGSPGDILYFLQCYDEYKVQAFTLQPNGKWIVDKKNPLKMQVQNLASIQDTSVSQMMFKRSIETILKAINPAGLTAANAKSVLGAAFGHGTAEIIVEGVNKTKDALELIKSLKEYVNTDEKSFSTFYEKFVACKDSISRIKLLLETLGNSKFLKTQNKWADIDFVDPKKDMSVTLTSYARPSNRVRATYVFDSPEENFEEVANAFEALIVNTKAAKAILNIIDKEKPMA